MRDTGYADACPIATVALEVASTSEPLRQATADVFESWLAELTARFGELGLTKIPGDGISPCRLFCLLEGAFILARATQDDTHVRTAGTHGFGRCARRVRQPIGPARADSAMATSA